MQVRFLVGPPGSGKTFLCLKAAREILLAAPEGSPLILLAPKQGTYQLEQQLLSERSVSGYARLHIVSFESLAQLVLDLLQRSSPRRLDEEGRLMVLRSLLIRHRDKLKLFRASARLNGFAQELGSVLRDLLRNCLAPADIHALAARLSHAQGLAFKLHDLAMLLAEYLAWLKTHNLQDTDCLLDAAAEALRETRRTSRSPSLPGNGSAPGDQSESPRMLSLHLAQVWVDGFSEFSQQELALLTELLPCCEQATLTFCIPGPPPPETSWLSPWHLVGKTFDYCRQRIGSVPGVEIVTEVLPKGNGTRFCRNHVLQHLQHHWGEPVPFHSSSQSGSAIGELEKTIRIVACPNPEAEAKLAAREILRFVRAGARFRHISVLTRKLAGYDQVVQRVFSRYEIPCFLDRRESIAHHPLAELTRSALRTVAFGWQHEDWFAVLKSGLVTENEQGIDRLENEALGRGWRGAFWQQPIRLPELQRTTKELEQVRRLEAEMEAIRKEIIQPFENFAQALQSPAQCLSGSQIAAAIRELWRNLEIEQQLQAWADAEPATYESLARGSLHPTVWKGCQAWLDNVELAFPAEALSLRAWLPILEAGLANLTVGSVPPALDQVLVGAIDRSRTPEIKLAIVLGMNESVFPAPPQPGLLLTETDRLELEKCGVNLGNTSRRHLGYERYLAYITCTRASERVMFTCSEIDANGKPLNPSPFLSRVRQLFPSLAVERISGESDWRDSEHPHELILPLLKSADFGRLASGIQLPQLSAVVAQLQHFQNPRPEESLRPELAERLYGPVLRTSVSRMEQFAACPFKYFVHSGLRAEERTLFELDAREQGTFQHDVLALFHQQLQAEGKRWRDVTPEQARERVANIARNMLAGFRQGLLEATDEARFQAGVLTESLQDFIETLIGWMGQQYLFDPVQVEWAFGENDGVPPWSIELDQRHRLEIYGRIDRIDVYREEKGEETLCVVVDYKSGQQDLDPVLMAHGLQLQLLTYLDVLRRWPNPDPFFGARRLIPCGVFYVSLRGYYPRHTNRDEALTQTDAARKLAYRHNGRFDAAALRKFDARVDAHEGDQFNYRLTRAGKIHGSCREALPSGQFKALMDQVQTTLRNMGLQIFSGVADVSPYRKGSTTACDRCAYRAVCRIDPWTHRFRVLKP